MEEETIGRDDDTDEKYRVYASISFAVLLLGIGVPLWWHTTAVPRVALPYSGIDELAHLETRIRTKIVVAAPVQSRVESIAREIENIFSKAEICEVDVLRQIVSSKILSFASTYRDLEAFVSNTFNLAPGDVLLLESANLKDSVLIGLKRTLYFSTETAGEKLARILFRWILREESLTLTKNALTEPTSYSLDEENRRRFPTSPAYDISITLVNPDPEKLKIRWDLKAIAEDYVEPFLSGLSIISNFSVKSQWLYLVPLNVEPKRVPDSSSLGRHYGLPEDVLPRLITPLEKKLASQVSLHPSINFVIYAVPCDAAPLRIYARSGYRSKTDGNVEAFLSPRWGGILLINPPSESCEQFKDSEAVTYDPEETAIVGTFLAQLRLLLGIPDTPRVNGVSVVPLDGLNHRDWEIDALLRIRTVEQLTSAKLTLQSLSRLLTEIGNIVITEEVGRRIKTALKLVEDSADRLRRGDLREGFLLSKEAIVTAEAAFTDPTLLALLYFPEDQKYAVYIPLFLPAMIPVLLSLKNIRRYYFPGKTSKSKTEDLDEKKSN